MQITGHMLLHHLQNYFDIRYADCSQLLWVKNLIHYNIFFRMDEHIVIVQPEDAAACMKTVRNSVIVCIGALDRIPEHKHNNLIVIDDMIAESICLNIITVVQDLFHEWDARLDHILFNGMEFRGMIETIRDMVELPVSLVGENMKYFIFASAPDSTKRSGGEADHDELLQKREHELMNQPYFASSIQQKEAFVFRAPGCTAVCKNLYHDEQYIGRLDALTDESSDIEYCREIFDYAGPWLEKLYERNHGFLNATSFRSELQGYFKAILNSEAINTVDFRRCLVNNNCQPEDPWSVLSLISISDLQQHQAAYLRTQLEHYLPGSYCILHKGEIAVLLNERQLLAANVTLPMQFKLLEDLQLVAGCSRSFHEIALTDNVTDAYKQARFARINGAIAKPGKQMYHYDACALDYLLKYGSDGLSAEQICHPALLRLQDYDKRQATSYVRTLYVFMTHQFNATDSAKTLFIHRSSFINRMERIHELVDLDLANADECLFLLLSFRIMGYGAE